MNINHRFAQAANAIGRWLGSTLALTLSILLVLVWLVAGPFVGYSDTWQLVVQTVTSIFAFLLLIIVQNTQNRNAAALHVKLDELVRAIPQARTELATLSLADAPEDVIVEAHKTTQQLAQEVADDAVSGV